MRKFIICILTIFFCSSNSFAFDFNDYYKYAEDYFYYKQNGQTYYSDDKDKFCVLLATELYQQKADLKKLKSDLKKKQPLYLFNEECKFKREYREWGFVNRKELLTGKSFNNCGSYTFDKITDYNLVYEGWFRYYITLEKLEKKWKNKPMPNGMKEFLKKCKIKCY